jgi:hypothetical protein
MGSVEGLVGDTFPQRLKPHFVQGWMDGLKPVPFKASL